VIERLRILLDRPLDPVVARAALVLVLAVGVGVGFAIVVAVSGVDRDPAIGLAATKTASQGRPAVPAPGPTEMLAQDPQDRPGSAAHRRAARELADHRALQHVPFSHGGVSIDLVGARGGRAVLRIEATSVAAARRAWKAFLRRYRDEDEAYVPIFEGNPRRRGS
jgi:hypothetical protein